MDEVPASEGFPPEIAARLGSYVYLLVDPRTGRPFSVGRGRNDRCFRHVRAAHGDDDEAKFPQLDRVRQIEATGGRVRIDVLRHGLTAEEAKLVEAAAIDALGLAGRPAAGRQRATAATLRSTMAKPAKVKRAHQVVLLRVGGAPGGDGPDGAGLDQQVRGPWRIGRRWVDLSSPRSPRWAVAVVDGVARAVYRIDGWKSETVHGASSGSAPRFSLVGGRDPDLEKRYVGRSMAAYLGAGSPSLITYVWCGPHWVNTPR